MSASKANPPYTNALTQSFRLNPKLRKAEHYLVGRIKFPFTPSGIDLIRAAL